MWRHNIQADDFPITWLSSVLLVVSDKVFCGEHETLTEVILGGGRFTVIVADPDFVLSAWLTAWICAVVGLDGAV